MFENVQFLEILNPNWQQMPDYQWIFWGKYYHLRLFGVKTFGVVSSDQTSPPVNQWSVTPHGELYIVRTLKEDQPLRLLLNLLFYHFNRSQPTYKAQRIKLRYVIAACNQLNVNALN